MSWEKFYSLFHGGMKRQPFILYFLKHFVGNLTNRGVKRPSETITVYGGENKIFLCERVEWVAKWGKYLLVSKQKLLQKVI